MSLLPSQKLRRKSLILWFLFVMTLSLQTHENALAETYSWKKGIVSKVLDNNHILLSNGEKIKLIGIQAPDIFFPEKSEQCLTRFIFRSLRMLLEGQEIKWKSFNTFQKNFSLGFVKIQNKDVSLFLLERGMARFRSFSEDSKNEKNYLLAEQQAKEAQEGIWGGCEKENIRTYLQAQGYFEQGFRKKYASFLAPISVGTVAEVITGQSFILDNGLHVKMLGIEVPTPDDPRKGFQCFGKASKEHLENLILGKRVYLKKDISQFNEDKELLKEFELFGTPNIIFFDKNNKFLPEKSLTGFVPPEDFAKHLESIK